MTFAPPTIRELAAYYVARGGTNLGIVGDTSHVNSGTSYHLGRSQLREDAYSIVLQRDKAGLSEAASAIDLGKLNGSLFNLQIFSQWLVRQCQARAPGTGDIREVIYTPNGMPPIHRWSDPDRVIYTGSGQGDLTHLYHTHISFYRDSEFRPKTLLFVPYFEAEPPESSTEPPQGSTRMILDFPQETYGRLTTARNCRAYNVANGQLLAVGAGNSYPVVATSELRGLAGRKFIVVSDGSPDPYAIGSALLAFEPADVSYAPPSGPVTADCAAAIEADRATARIVWS